MLTSSSVAPLTAVLRTCAAPPDLKAGCTASWCVAEQTNVPGSLRAGEACGVVHRALWRLLLLFAILPKSIGPCPYTQLPSSITRITTIVVTEKTSSDPRTMPSNRHRPHPNSPPQARPTSTVPLRRSTGSHCQYEKNSKIKEAISPSSLSTLGLGHVATAERRHATRRPLVTTPASDIAS